MWQLPKGIVKQVRPPPDWHLTNSCHSEDPEAPFSTSPNHLFNH